MNACKQDFQVSRIHRPAAGRWALCADEMISVRSLRNLGVQQRNNVAITRNQAGNLQSSFFHEPRT